MSTPPAGPSGRGMRNFLLFLVALFLAAFLYFYFSPGDSAENSPDEGAAILPTSAQQHA